MPVFTWACAGPVRVETRAARVCLTGTVTLGTCTYAVCFTPCARTIDVVCEGDDPLFASGRVASPLNVVCTAALLKRCFPAQWAAVPATTRAWYDAPEVACDSVRETRTADGFHLVTAALLYAHAQLPIDLTTAWRRTVRSQGRVVGRLCSDGRDVTFSSRGGVTVAYGYRSLACLLH